MMKAINGNILQWIDVCFQNIPLGVSLPNKEKTLEQILHRFKPHILGVAEPRRLELEMITFPGMIKTMDIVVFIYYL